jgi:tol-pal system protein YbgF
MKKHRFLPNLSVLAVAAAIVAGGAFAQQSQTPADFETRLSTLEDEMRSLNGRLEQLEFATRQQAQDLQRIQGDFDGRLQRLESAAATPQPQAPIVPPQAGMPAAPNGGEAPAAAPENANGTLGALKLQDGRVTGGVDNPQAPPLPQAPSDYGLTPQEQYDAAFALLRQADYDAAGKAFKDFIDKNPKDKLASNAKYWYGETLYVRGELDQAAVAFADAWQQDPQGVKAPDSLLKLAMSLAATGKAQDACTALGELKTKYPNASPTIHSRAAEEASKIKCGH